MCTSAVITCTTTKSSHRTYSTAQQHHLRFSQRTGLQPIPVLKHQLMPFAVCLALKGLKWQTIKTYPVCSAPPPPGQGPRKGASRTALAHDSNSCCVVSGRQLPPGQRMRNCLSHQLSSDRCGRQCTNPQSPRIVQRCGLP